MVPTAAPAAPEVEVANPSAVDEAACAPSPPSGPGRRFGSSSSLPLPVRSIASIVVAEVLTPIGSLESGESDAGRRTEYDAVTQSQAVVYGRVRVRVCVWGYLGLLSGDVRSKGEQGKQNQRSCSSIGCEFDALLTAAFSCSAYSGGHHPELACVFSHLPAPPPLRLYCTAYSVSQGEAQWAQWAHDLCSPKPGKPLSQAQQFG